MQTKMSHALVFGCTPIRLATRRCITLTSFKNSLYLLLPVKSQSHSMFVFFFVFESCLPPEPPARYMFFMLLTTSVGDAFLTLRRTSLFENLFVKLIFNLFVYIHIHIHIFLINCCIVNAQVSATYVAVLQVHSTL